MRYQFTGTYTEIFPTVITEAGTLVCEPGDTVELDGDIDHPRLVADNGAGAATHTADVVRTSEDFAEHLATIAATDGKRAAKQALTRRAAKVTPKVSADPVSGPDESTTEV